MQNREEGTNEEVCRWMLSYSTKTPPFTIRATLQTTTCSPRFHFKNTPHLKHYSKTPNFMISPSLIKIMNQATPSYPLSNQSLASFHNEGTATPVCRHHTSFPNHLPLPQTPFFKTPISCQNKTLRRVNYSLNWASINQESTVCYCERKRERTHHALRKRKTHGSEVEGEGYGRYIPSLLIYFQVPFLNS